MDVKEFVHAIRQRVIPAVPVPFDADGNIDEQLHGEYIQWMSTQDVGAVAVWAHTGRGRHLSADQRAEVLAAWRSEHEQLPVVCGVGVPESESLPNDVAGRTELAIRKTVDVAEQALRGGASALLAHPPPFGDLDDVDTRVFDYHRALSEVGLPVIAFYLYEAAGGVEYSDAVVKQILNLDNVVGIKLATLDSVMTFQNLTQIIEPTGALLITGEDRFLGYSLTLGADCALVGMAAACTDVCVALLDAWFAGGFSEFLLHSAALDRFAQATFTPPMEGYVQRMLWAAVADQVLSKDAFDPYGPMLTAGDRARVVEAVDALRGA